MANTADTLGEQETLDGLVAHSLEDFEDSRIKKIREYAFRHNDGLKSVNLPNATNVLNDSFSSCWNIENVKIPKINIINDNIFYYCYKLKSVDISNTNRIYGNAFYYCFSLNNIDLSNVSSTSNNAIKDTGIGALVLPNATSIGTYAVQGKRTSTIDLSKNITINGNKFNGANSLVHLILRSDTLCSFSATSAFTNTPIVNGLGWIYVPSDLVDSYKSASNWSTYANQIVSLDEYPKALSGETIADSWDEIFQAEEDGSYKTKYNVGDTKYLVIGGTYVLIQIIAFDRDILSSDHTSTAKITWLSKSLSFEFPMNFENVTEGGWADCECRKFLSDTIYGQIPETVRNKIVAVDKTYTATSSSSSTATVSDKLWIPSAREIYGGSSYENTGINYTDFFTSNSARIKHNGLLTNSASDWYWWLRSVGGSISFRYVDTSGDVYSGYASISYGVTLGFCT